MGDVVNLADHRPVRTEQAINRAVSLITDEWDRYSRNNRLHELVVHHLGHHAKPFVSYLANLNELAIIEAQLELIPIVCGPQTQTPAQHGWRVVFTYGGELIETPDMPLETHARAFALLVMQALRRSSLVTLERPLTDD